MPRYLPVQVDAANSEIQAVYTEVEDALGSLPNLIKTLAHSPNFLKTVTDFYLGVLRGESALGDRIRQLVVLKTCQLDKCKVTLDQQTPAAREAGLTDEQIQALGEYAGSDLFDNYEQEALTLVEKILTSPDDISQTQFWTQLDNHFTSDQVVEMVVLTGAFNMINRIILALQVEPDPVPAAG